MANIYVFNVDVGDNTPVLLLMSNKTLTGGAVTLLESALGRPKAPIVLHSNNMVWKVLDSDHGPSKHLLNALTLQ
jgi:hypothetical protein